MFEEVCEGSITRSGHIAESPIALVESISVSPPMPMKPEEFISTKAMTGNPNAGHSEDSTPAYNVMH